MNIEVTFKVEKETKNTVRYAEVPRDDAEPAIGVLYVRKSVVKALGNPEFLSVRVEAIA